MTYLSLCDKSYFFDTVGLSVIYVRFITSRPQPVISPPLLGGTGQLGMWQSKATQAYKIGRNMFLGMAGPHAWLGSTFLLSFFPSFLFPPLFFFFSFPLFLDFITVRYNNKRDV